jgi:hypothetical protein
MPFTVRKTPPALTPGSYRAQIADVKVIDGQFGQRLMWTVELAHGGYSYRATGYTDPTFYQGSLEHRWASAALGQDLQADEEISEAELIGAPVTVQIATKPGRDGLKTFYTITDLRPPLMGDESESPVTETTKTAETSEEDVPF